MSPELENLGRKWRVPARHFYLGNGTGDLLTVLDRPGFESLINQPVPPRTSSPEEEEQIRKIAHHLYLERQKDSILGTEQDDWLEAEKLWLAEQRLRSKIADKT